MTKLAKKNQIWVLITMLTTGTFLRAVNPAECYPRVDAERTYVGYLENKFLHNFLPPRGEWALSDGAAKATLECDGRIKNIIVTKPLSNPFNKRCGQSYTHFPISHAIEFASPVEAPPKTMRCPATLVINFFCKDKKAHGGYICKVVLK